MKLSTYPEWVMFLNQLNPKEIDLSLDRIQEVAQKLQISPLCPVLIVGGTNGKGSTVTALESIYRASGFRTGLLTSPFFFHHCEQVRLNGLIINESTLCLAFAEIEKARGEVKLTMFEFCTLAAFWLFQNEKLDVWILEVGLGGRLDAVNVLDADVAVITSISLDHEAWLGSTREAIGYEKAGIFRVEKPAVCGELSPPASIVNYAKDHHVPLYCIKKEYDYEVLADSWNFKTKDIYYQNLPLNKLATQNMATALMAVHLLQKKLPVKIDAIKEGLKTANLPGRIQVIKGDITEIHDVAHNPAAVKHLATVLKEYNFNGNIHAVFSMLSDKDSLQSILEIKHMIHDWYVAPLNTPRATSLVDLRKSFCAANVNENVNFYVAMNDAYLAAKNAAKKGDVILVFGSFHTVSEVMGR